MQSYGQLMHMTLYAVTVIWLSDAAVGNRNLMLLSQAREERCVVTLGTQLADLEGQVAAYLKAYRDTLGPALGKPEADK